MGRALKMDMEGMKQRGTGGGGERSSVRSIKNLFFTFFSILSFSR